MLPSFTDFFKSFYYSNTYVSPVDLSDKSLSTHLLASTNAKKAQKLISRPEVKSMLSEPLSCDWEKIQDNNAILGQHQFKLLNKKNLILGKIIPYYNVLEHETLPGWVIKAGAIAFPKGSFPPGPRNNKKEMAVLQREENLLRIEMSRRIAKIAKEVQVDVILPQKKLLAYQNSDKECDVTRKYCLICEKVEVLSAKETLEAIKSMDASEQKELAHKISLIVRKAGIAGATFNKIRLTQDRKMAIINTEPSGLMTVKKTGFGKFFGGRGASVEKCARIGLFNLLQETLKTDPVLFFMPKVLLEPGLESFHEELKKNYDVASKPNFSKRKIRLSIVSLGLIPLINVIRAFALHSLAKGFGLYLNKLDRHFTSRSTSYMTKKANELLEENPALVEDVVTLNILVHNEIQKEKFFIKFERQRPFFAKVFFRLIEGVPSLPKSP
ncbi:MULTISPECIES: hypothetical protein [Parachlamydia]|uniref:hypothetical protein n=1 Tax=Parachlamydia TaxID=83551 RepID=UPI0001C17C68|nr:hypothetical protein [Parachlamydia acanthamoebae]EFB42324.1 hypothetical protein pah_c010o010 [Parachlamydia acanthamoebae str. Hall's coccus]